MFFSEEVIITFESFSEDALAPIISNCPLKMLDVDVKLFYRCQLGKYLLLDITGDSDWTGRGVTLTTVVTS